MQAWSQFVLICFRIKFYEDWVSKLNWKIEFFVSSTGHQNCLNKSLSTICDPWFLFVVFMSTWNLMYSCIFIKNMLYFHVINYIFHLVLSFYQFYYLFLIHENLLSIFLCQIYWSLFLVSFLWFSFWNLDFQLSKSWEGDQLHFQ